jgi:hypothetical protein
MAVAELDGVEVAVELAVELAAGVEAGVVAGAEEVLEDELLQAAAVTPRQAMPSTAANRLAYVRLVSIPRR